MLGLAIVKMVLPAQTRMEHSHALVQVDGKDHYVLMVRSQADIQEIVIYRSIHTHIHAYVLRCRGSVRICGVPGYFSRVVHPQGL